MRCVYCGGEILEGDRFCMYCGKPVEKEKPKEKPKCAVCGFELIEGYRFCMNCGTPVLPNGEQPKMRPKEKPKCAVCGFELIEGYKFCMNCGTPVQAKKKEPEPEIIWEPAPVEEPAAEPAAAPEPASAEEPAAESEPVPVKEIVPEPAAAPDPEEELARELADALSRAEEMKAGTFGKPAAEPEAEPAEEEVPPAEETAPSGEPEPAAEEKPEPPAEEAAAEEEPDPAAEPPAEEAAEEEPEPAEEAAKEKPDPAGEEGVFSEPETVRHAFPGGAAQQTMGKRYLILSNLDQPQFVYRVPMQTEVTIGRMQTDITIADDPELSRTHCRIILKDEVLYLVDAGSKNGTFLLGNRLESGKEAVLRSGDLLRIGQHAYAVELKTI